MRSNPKPTDWPGVGPLPQRRHDPAVQISLLFLANFVLMRVSCVPNLSIPLTIPLVLGWCVYALRAGILTVEMNRALLWLAAAGVSALVPIGQLLWVPDASLSVMSWGLWMLLWLPTVFRLAHPTADLFVRTCRGVAWVGFGLSLLSMAFVASQALGLPYRDYFGDLFPKQFQVIGFSTTVPISWGNPIHKSNAWLALEPSFVSFTLGAALLAGLVAGHRWWVLVVNLLGVFSSFAGSGLALIVMAAGLAILLGHARRYAVPMVAGALMAGLASFTALGPVVFGRVGEVGAGQSSTALRATLPYEVLVPEFFRHLSGVFLGYGAGSSRRIIDGASMLGLLVPTPAKLIFDYGLPAGLLLLAVVFAAHWRSPAPMIALPILVSLLVLQAVTQPMITVLLLLVTWWAPSRFRQPDALSEDEDHGPWHAWERDPGVSRPVPRRDGAAPEAGLVAAETVRSGAPG